MSFDTYANLKSEVADWANRTDLTAQIPGFIALLEADLLPRLRHRRMETRNSAFSIDSATEATPTDLQSVIAFEIAGSPSNPLRQVDAADIDRLRATTFQTAGKPHVFAIVGTNFEFCPTPDATYTAELIYRASLAALSDSNTSNWLLANYPNVYLYGALEKAAGFLSDAESEAKWAGKLANALAEIDAGEDRTALRPAMAITGYS